jgi:hypothetical protein
MFVNILLSFVNIIKLSLASQILLSSKEQNKAKVIIDSSYTHSYRTLDLNNKQLTNHSLQILFNKLKIFPKFCDDVLEIILNDNQKKTDLLNVLALKMKTG